MSHLSTQGPDTALPAETAAMLEPSRMSPMARVVTTVLRSREIAIAAVLLLVIAAATAKTSSFLFSSNSWRDLLLTPSILILLAVGEAVVIITRNVDLSNNRLPYILVPIVVLAVIFALLLHFTSFGRGIFDIGLNSEAAHFSGVDVARTKLVVFVLAGAVSAFAGIYYTLRFGSARGDNATGLELQVIAAVLLGGVSIFGGRGALHGVLGGVLLIAAISSALRLENVTVNVINIIIGLLLVLSVISTSLLGWVSKLGRGAGTRRGQAAPRERRVTA